MPLVSQTKRGDQPILGPTITAEVVIEGVSVSALLDTGSPVSIISLEFIVNVLAKQRTQDQTPQEWRASVKKRLEPSAVNMWNYGGGPLQFN